MNPLTKLTISMLLLFIAAAIFLSIKLNQENSGIFQAYGTILGAIVGISALIFVGYQALQLGESVNLQRNEFALEHRPYLYVELELNEQTLYIKSTDKVFTFKLKGIWPNEKETAYFGGGNLYFKNVGKDPATITKTEYIVRSDLLRDLDFVQWFKDAYGGFPDITSVMPNQQNLRVPCHPMVSTQIDKPPKLIYVGAVISYVGPQVGSKKERKYWYKFSQLFIVSIEEIEIEGIKKTLPVLHPHIMDTDWDQNEGEEPPPLKDPNWDELLKKSYIKTLTERNR